MSPAVEERARAVLEPLLGEVALLVDGRPWTWEVMLRVDAVLVAAQLERAGRGRAALERVAIPDAAVDAAEERFRQDRNLLRGEEAEAWLAGWCVDARTFREAIRGELALTASEEEEEDAEKRSEPERARALAVYTGALGDRLLAIAGTAALTGRSVPNGPDAVEAMADEARRQALSELTPARRASLLERHRRPWTRVVGRVTAWPSRGAALEALNRVRDDGDDLVELAERHGLGAASVEMRVEEAAPCWHRPLASAMPGDLVGPVLDRSAWGVLCVSELHPPDATASARDLEEVWIRETLERVQGRKVRWTARFAPTGL